MSDEEIEDGLIIGLIVSICIAVGLAIIALSIAIFTSNKLSTVLKKLHSLESSPDNISPPLPRFQIGQLPFERRPVNHQSVTIPIEYAPRPNPTSDLTPTLIRNSNGNETNQGIFTRRSNSLAGLDSIITSYEPQRSTSRNETIRPITPFTSQITSPRVSTVRATSPQSLGHSRSVSLGSSRRSSNTFGTRTEI